MIIKPGTDVVSIRRDQIIPFFGQPREHFDYDRLVELAASMRDRGQLQPVLVTRVDGATAGDPQYRLLDGERRWRAAELAKLDTLLALVSDMPPGDESYVASVVANSAREDLTPIECSRAVARISKMANYDPTKRDGLAKLAAVFGRSQGWASQMLKLDGLAPEVKTLVEGGKLSSGAAVELASVKSPARQAEIGKRIASQPMRQSAAVNAARNAVRVEQVREGQAPKPLAGTSRSTSAADRQLVAEMIGRTAESTESLLDLPAARLREAYKGHPKELAGAVKRARDASAALDQLRGALSKLSQEQS